MNHRKQLYILGEVLYDCFPTGEKILGGAPFNVSWNLQSFGNQPEFISRIGKDVEGDKILAAMQNWGMNTDSIQVDQIRPTGRVEVVIQNNEPSYNIVENSAYDFINKELVPNSDIHGILYHGTLCFRNQISHSAYNEMLQNHNLKIFVDVNLRSPWWKKERVLESLRHAHWVKMNEDELNQLTDTTENIQTKMAEFQKTYNLNQVIITRGAQGTIILAEDSEFHSQTPQEIERIVDTVGAGDAFSSVYIHGLRAGWPVDLNLRCAQMFAGKVIGLRGATTTDSCFYEDFISSIASHTDKY